jgi:hypothetical protein
MRCHEIPAFPVVTATRDSPGQHMEFKKVSAVIRGAKTLITDVVSKSTAEKESQKSVTIGITLTATDRTLTR